MIQSLISNRFYGIFTVFTLVFVSYSFVKKHKKTAIPIVPVVIDTSEMRTNYKNMACEVMGYCQILYIGKSEKVIVVEKVFKRAKEYMGSREPSKQFYPQTKS
jgi:hypothetical protein